MAPAGAARHPAPPDPASRDARAGDLSHARRRRPGPPSPIGEAALRGDALQPSEGVHAGGAGGLRAARRSRGAGREPEGAPAAAELLGADARGPEPAPPLLSGS